MTIYVNDINASMQFGSLVRCWMIADTEDELHEMARKLRVSRGNFHHVNAVHSRYEMPPSKRAMAIALGAVVMDEETMLQSSPKLNAAKSGTIEKTEPVQLDESSGGTGGEPVNQPVQVQGQANAPFIQMPDTPPPPVAHSNAAAEAALASIFGNSEPYGPCSNPLLYAGIGSRDTPPRVLALMERVAIRLAKLGWALRSGAAPGADSAFERGAIACNGDREIWLPWEGFQGHADTGLYPLERHFRFTGEHHDTWRATLCKGPVAPYIPTWERMKAGTRKLYARNSGQVLGEDLVTPVKFVLCWTPDGCESHADRSLTTGGTGVAISIASGRGIPVFNLFHENALERLKVLLDSLETPAFEPLVTTPIP